MSWLGSRSVFEVESDRNSMMICSDTERPIPRLFNSAALAFLFLTQQRNRDRKILLI
jgi:hypothetical protein